MSKRNLKKFSGWRFFPFATGVKDTGGKSWAANISANFQKKFETALGAWGKLFHEKNQKQKISWHCHFKKQVRIGRWLCLCSLCPGAIKEKKYMLLRIVPSFQLVMLVNSAGFEWSFSSYFMQKFMTQKYYDPLLYICAHSFSERGRESMGS